MSIKQSRKHPLQECLGENSSEPQNKRCRRENVVLVNRNIRSRRRRASRRNYNNDSLNSNSQSSTSQRQNASAAKRKKPEETITATAGSVAGEGGDADENDIISELTNEFKKARLRPVFFTFSSFIEQTVDEVGFTMAEEPETETTFRFTLRSGKKANPLDFAVSTSDGEHISGAVNDDVAVSTTQQIRLSGVVGQVNTDFSDNNKVSQITALENENYNNNCYFETPHDQREVSVAEFVFSLQTTENSDKNFVD